MLYKNGGIKPLTLYTVQITNTTAQCVKLITIIITRVWNISWITD